LQQKLYITPKANRRTCKQILFPHGEENIFCFKLRAKNETWCLKFMYFLLNILYFLF